ncbi:cell surface protein [Methanosarcina horonobensis HB-1 = JCM 15518]|uniref:Cell surface protein n=3 Tax=Methanosarcina horonobensis TaxID=418008 RepID=A0A0E3SAK8_9EURY|nr:cell surface protein [Methanosarcina horonobensis HB-1 = JCM 15518]
MDGQNVNDTPDAYYKWDDTQVLYAVEIDDQSNVSLESIKAGIDYAIANEYVLLLYGHVITSGTPAEYQTSTSKLEEILSYTKAQGGDFYLLGDLGNSSWSSATSNVTANFTISADTIVAGGDVTFVGYSINQTSEFLDFGDGTSSTSANVTHTYATPGTYNAVLTVTNGIHSHSITKTIIVTTGRTGGVALSWDDVQNIGPCYENLATFQTYNASCTMNINNLSAWGQGTTDNLSALHNAGWEIAGHGYNHLNSIEFLNNSTSEEWLNQEIFPNIAEITGYGYPVYSLAYPYSSRNETTDSLLAPYFRTLRSTNFETVNVNESNAYYKWDDARVVYGVEIDDQSNVSLESIKYGIDYAMQHGYVLVLYGHAITSNVTGEYQTSTSRLESILNYTNQKNGTFYLMGDLGNSSWVPSGRFSNVIANFTVSSDNVYTGENVTFADYSVNHTIQLLDFGDGSNSSTANVVHKYTTPGTYTVNLTVTNDVSNQSITKTITVIQSTPPVANFTSNLTTGLAPLDVAFTDASTGLPTPTSWLWDFGDGYNSTEQSPKHTYSAAGSYTVNLTVSNLNSTTSTTATITVLNESNVLPVANFSMSVTRGDAPLSVTFTDLSQYATSWTWDFGDGASSTDQNPTHEYSSAGTYTVKLTAKNANGENSTTAQIIADRKSSGGSSNGGGGGGGGSPEPARNVEVKELSQVSITNGKAVQFDFTKNATCVVSVGFDAKKTVGKTTTIVEQLKNKSTLVSNLSDGVVYKYFNVWVGNSGFATSANIENPALCFKVEKAWIKDKNIDKDSITLNRYSNKTWEKLPASLSGEDNKYLYFKSSVPGYSFFAITGKMTSNEEDESHTGEATPNSGTQEQDNTEPGIEPDGDSKITPGFEMIYCILGLLGVFLYRRK